VTTEGLWIDQTQHSRNCGRRGDRNITASGVFAQAQAHRLHLCERPAQYCRTTRPSVVALYLESFGTRRFGRIARPWPAANRILALRARDGAAGAPQPAHTRLPSRNSAPVSMRCFRQAGVLRTGRSRNSWTRRSLLSVASMPLGPASPWSQRWWPRHALFLRPPARRRAGAHEPSPPRSTGCAPSSAESTCESDRTCLVSATAATFAVRVCRSCSRSGLRRHLCAVRSAGVATAAESTRRSRSAVADSVHRNRGRRAALGRALGRACPARPCRPFASSPCRFFRARRGVTPSNPVAASRGRVPVLAGVDRACPQHPSSKRLPARGRLAGRGRLPACSRPTACHSRRMPSRPRPTRPLPPPCAWSGGLRQ